MSINNYSSSIISFKEDYLYKYKGLYINCNFSSTIPLTEYKKSLKWLDVALVSTFSEEGSCDAWSLVFNDSTIDFINLSQKPRYEIKKFEALTEVITIKNMGEYHKLSIKIIECFKRAFFSNSGKEPTETEIDDYIRQIKCHIISDSSDLFVTITDQKIIGLALVNLLHPSKTINLKNVKIDYNHKGISITIGLVYFINNYYEDYFNKGYVFHAGTQSILHNSSFHEAILVRKLGFKKQPLQATVLTNRLFYSFIIIIKTIIKALKLKGSFLNVISSVTLGERL